MSALVLFLLAATPVEKAPSPAKTDLRAPDPEYRCVDGSMAPSRAMCPPNAPPSMDNYPAPPAPITFPLEAPREYPIGPRPRNNPGTWATTNDYPSRALLNEWMGQASFRLTIGEDGKASSCEITRTSGYASIDLATCSNIRRRARFMPALDAKGNPTIGTYANRVTWRIPTDRPEYDQAMALEIATAHDGLGPDASPRGRSKKPDPLRYETWIPEEPLPQTWRYKNGVSYTVAVNQQGRVDYCFIRESSGDANLDGYVCQKVTANAEFAAATDAEAMPTKGFFLGGFTPVSLREEDTLPKMDLPMMPASNAPKSGEIPG